METTQAAPKTPGSNGNNGDQSKTQQQSNRARKRAYQDAMARLYRAMAMRYEDAHRYLESIIGVRRAEAELIRAEARAVAARVEMEREESRAVIDLMRAEAEALRRPTPAAAPGTVAVVNQPWWQSFWFFLAMLALIVGTVYTIANWPASPSPAKPIQASPEQEITQMFGKAVEPEELKLQGDVYEFTFKPELHSLQFGEEAEIYVTVAQGWIIKDNIMKLSFRENERHYFKLKSGAWEARRAN